MSNTANLSQSSTHDEMDSFNDPTDKGVPINLLIPLGDVIAQINISGAKLMAKHIDRLIRHLTIVKEDIEEDQK